MVTGLVCAVCGERVGIDVPLSWTCPRSSEIDRHHVLRFEVDIEPFRPADSVNPFVAFRRYLAVDALGEKLGLPDDVRERLIVDADRAVAAVAGTGFLVTPFERADGLSDELGFAPGGGVWVKDETRNVGGSHKARHLFTELLHLLMVERAGFAPWTPATRPPLAISSCGNAAIAASMLARSADWPIQVYVPTAASESVLATLATLNAQVTVCPRRDDDPPGDPCMHRFREAVRGGAIPFAVVGPENAWCLDGGRTIGWEMLTALDRPVDRIFVQVGGGAFASCVGAAMAGAGIHPKLHAVQTEGCAPLARAWERVRTHGGSVNAGRQWAECMWPWEATPTSIADGILDDETYDWISVVTAMERTGGSPVVAHEDTVVRAHSLARSATDIDVSPTGSAGLAGLMDMRGSIADDERVAVIFSGVRR